MGPPSPTSYDPISYTARKVLEKRARHTTIPYAREMAQAAGVDASTSRIRSWARNLAWGKVRSGLYLQFRHDAISNALNLHPGSAVLEIGAGFGTRGMTESGLREAYIESDLPNVIARKPQLVETILSGKARPQHHFISVNACSAADMFAASEFILRLNLQRPLVIIHEGILMYLNRREQEAFRDNIHQILSRCSPSGSWITTDFSERDFEDSLIQKCLTRSLTRKIQRQFNRFENDQAVATFLSQGGFRFQKLPNLMERHPDSEVRRVAESFRAWTIML